MRFTMWLLTAVIPVIACSLTTPAAEDRATRVRNDRTDILAGGQWIYNDLERGFAEAREGDKPLLVVLRCIPCEACRGFDEQIASIDPRVQRLLERFVRVRIPQGNGLDLSLFQFDYDLSFYAFFLNADRTIYGRFGSRSTQKDKTGEVSIDAFRETMLAVLKLHDRYPEVKDSLRAKTGPAPPYQVPEEYPALKGRYEPTLDYEGAVVRGCIHCHQIRDSDRLIYRSAGKPIPDKVLHPWPLPEVFGMHLDPRARARVSRVEAGSVAERAGFRDGDALVSLQGQPLVSIADVEWVLHHAGEGGWLAAKVRRGDEVLTLDIPLTPGWRRGSDISWRVTTWELRRMGTGGMLLEDLAPEDRRRAGIASDQMALFVKHVGQYGEHATAKKAGAKKGDIIVAVDGQTGPMRESDFISYAVQQKMPGEQLELTVLREGERKRLTFAVK